MKYTKDHHPREKTVILEIDQLPEQPAEFIYRPPNMKEIESDPRLKEKFKIAQEITKHTQTTKVNNAESESKTLEQKSKEIHCKPNKTAMAKI